MTGWSSSGLVQSRVLAGALIEPPWVSRIGHEILSRNPVRPGGCRLGRTMQEPPGSETGLPGWSRRRFLSVAAMAAVGATVPGPVVSKRLLQMNGYPIDAETPLDLLTTFLTPNDLFFVRHHWNPVFPDPKTWSLTVDGEVG